MTGQTICPGTVDSGNHGDDVVTALALPFSFSFYGTPFSSANVSSNGNLQFTSMNGAFTNVCPLPTATMNNLISPFWDDLRTDGGTNGIFTSVNGAAPNRIFCIEWRAIYFGTTTTLNFEIQLHETTNDIDFVYGTLNGTGSSATVGLQRDTGSAFSQFSCNQPNLSDGLKISWTFIPGCVAPTPTPTPTPSPTPTPQPSPTPSPGCGILLYDQTDMPAANSTVSQDFETANNAFDNQGADDFVVPAGNTWTIQQVKATGVYFNGPGPAASFNVTFYLNTGANLPGAAVAGGTYTGLAYTNVTGVFTMTLPTSLVLGPGTYWVSVQARMDFTPGGEWGWTDRTVTSNSGAAWQNPGGGFGTPCTTWGRRGASCGIDAVAPDQIFQILGCLTIP